MDWKKWSEIRPEDSTKFYRWRVSPRLILGLEMQPEWVEKMKFVGMGYADSEWWPPYSNWDGYKRTIDPTLEWQEADQASNVI